MTGTDILNNINYLLAKKELFNDQGKKDFELDMIITMYNICKESVPDRQKKILELYYEKNWLYIETTVEIGCCTKTF